MVASALGRVHHSTCPAPMARLPTSSWAQRSAAVRVSLRTPFPPEYGRDDLRLWDDELKPASLQRQQNLYAVDLPTLDDAGLRRHVEQCASNLTNMVYQHHRFNLSALVPVGDFLVQASAWVQMPPPALLDALGGSSPISSLVPPELSAALSAVKADPEAQRLVREVGDAALRLAQLVARVPQMAEYIAHTGYRLVDGFDVTRPTAGECPDLGRAGCAWHAARRVDARRLTPFPRAAAARAAARRWAAPVAGAPHVRCRIYD